jgi:hypothetical protein
MNTFLGERGSVSEIIHPKFTAFAQLGQDNPTRMQFVEKFARGAMNYYIVIGLLNTSMSAIFGAALFAIWRQNRHSPYIAVFSISYAVRSLCFGIFYFAFVLENPVIRFFSQHIPHVGNATSVRWVVPPPQSTPAICVIGDHSGPFLRILILQAIHRRKFAHPRHRPQFRPRDRGLADGF